MTPVPAPEERVGLVSASQLQTGQVFAHKFQIIRRLKQGGMGAVYEAMHQTLAQKVALKVMLPEAVGNPLLRAKFLKEAQLSASLRHENIVLVHDAGVDAETGLPWLAMELLEGEDITDAITHHGAVGLPQAQKICNQIGAALHLAHENGIVHRDIKPGNIYLCEAGRGSAGRCTKVLDFGIARVVSEIGGAHTGTASWGSPLWMAPEQILTERPIGPGTDIWPLGLLMFFVLTGHHYWRVAERPEPSLGDWMSEALSGTLPAASQRAKELGCQRALPAGFDTWFARCMARELDRRYGSAVQACADFAALPRGRSGGSFPSANIRRALYLGLAIFGCVLSFVIGKIVHDKIVNDRLRERWLSDHPFILPIYTAATSSADGGDMGTDAGVPDAATALIPPDLGHCCMVPEPPRPSPLIAKCKVGSLEACEKLCGGGRGDRSACSQLPALRSAKCQDGAITVCEKLCEDGRGDDAACAKEIALSLDRCKVGSCSECVDAGLRARKLKDRESAAKLFAIACTRRECNHGCLALKLLDDESSSSDEAR